MDEKEIKKMLKNAVEIIEELLNSTLNSEKLRTPIKPVRSEWSPVMGRCPVCQRPVVFDQCFCGHCGQALDTTGIQPESEQAVGA